MKRVDELLARVVEMDGSDLHMLAGDPPRVRVYGELRSLENTPLSAESVAASLAEVMPEHARATFDRGDGVDFAYEIEGVSRFRVNVLRHINGLGAVFRAIPSHSMALDDLGLPPVVASLSMQRHGLVLVTGKTGSGKTTTLAAVVHDINSRRRCHIITIEDPIEFLHERKRALISQRQVGLHTSSFASALRSALREDPDVILVGEMRDLETISLAVTAAETGILVLGTLHTSGAASTVDRIVNAFPAGKQGQIRSMLSTSLRGVISQQLVRRADRRGRVAAIEILVNTPAVANLIREGRSDQLGSTMQAGALVGMQTMDGALRRLLEAGAITGREAYEKAVNKSEFESVRDQGT
jgi:twitching motility protein PilT